MKMISAISQWYRIPMGVLGWPYFVLTSSYKLYQVSKPYTGEIGSSDGDDPFTQKEKIGKGDQPPPLGGHIHSDRPTQPERQREQERERDYSEELGQDTRQEAQQEYYEDRMERLSGYDQYY